MTLNDPTNWIIRPRGNAFSSERSTKQISRSFSAVGNRRKLDVGIRQNVAQTGRDVLRNFSGAEASFELVGSDENTHGRKLLLPSYVRQIEKQACRRAFLTPP